MMIDWKEYSLSEIVEIIGGGTPKRSNPRFWNGNIPWLSVKDFNHSNRYVSFSEESITEEGLKNSSTKLLLPGQLIISARGTVGALAQLKKEMAFNQSCYGLNGKGNLVINDFLYYLLKHSLTNIQKITHGAVFDTITKNTFEHIKVKLPPIPLQQKIADILGSLDDKIELNRQMNHTLEAMARAIFKSWFVDFDPVYAKMEGRDYPLPPEIMDLFPDELEESELGLIPKGWRVRTLENLADNPKNVVNPYEVNESTNYIGLEHMPRRKIALDSWDYSKKVTSNKYSFRKGNILFGKLRPYFHKVGIAPIDGICSTDIIVINGIDKIFQQYLLFLMSSVEFVDTVSAASTGTKMPRTDWKYMQSYKIPIPPKIILMKFDSIVEPMVEKISLNVHVSKSLEKIREVVLPKLMSGELNV